MKTLRDETIGRDAEIVESKNLSLIGLKGKIIDETKFTFKLLVGNDVKTIMKKGNIFIISARRYDGNDLLKRPEERVKLRA